MKKKALFLFFSICPFLLISLFNHPSLDDYWNANTILSNGRFGAIQYSFNHFSGRYFSTFLMCVLNTLPQNEIWVFKIFPILICVGMVSALYYFIKKVFKLENNWKALISALMLTLLHIINMRVLYEGLYWMSATVTYQVGILNYITLTALIFSYVNKRSFPKMLGILILTVCISGTFESLEPLLLTTLAVLYFKFKKEKKSGRYPIIMYCLIINLICSVFVLSSTGAHSRIITDLSKFNTFSSHAFLRSFESVGYYYMIWLFSPYNILGLLILLSLIRSTSPDPQPAFSRDTYKKIFRIIFSSVVVSAMVYFPSLYLESNVPIARLTTLVFMIFCLTVAGILISAARHLNKILKILQQKSINNILWAIFFLSVLLSNNFIKVTTDLLSGTAFRFNREQNKRYSDLRNCPNDTCYIDSIKHWPASIEREPAEKDISNSILYWNTYFNKKKIFIK